MPAMPKDAEEFAWSIPDPCNNLWKTKLHHGALLMQGLPAVQTGTPHAVSQLILRAWSYEWCCELNPTGLCLESCCKDKEAPILLGAHCTTAHTVEVVSRLVQGLRCC
eukprot:Colp12_sorted_trinity150504_noHs@32036